MLCDIVINVISDIIFVLLIAFGVWILNRVFYIGRLGQAQQFFGFHHQTPIKIYVSGFEHPDIKTKRVVNAIEYETAVKIRYALQHLSEGGVIYRIVDFLAGLIGKELKFPEPEIIISPLDDMNESPYYGSQVLLGGPLSNRMTKHFLLDSPRFRFDEGKGKYQKRDKDEYHDIESSNNVAIIEKKVIENQVVLIVHGFGEEQTQRAAQYLIEHWKELYKQYKTQEFGIQV
jgi:hypothetical protein